jgi:hypothetical protein
VNRVHLLLPSRYSRSEGQVTPLANREKRSGVRKHGARLSRVSERTRENHGKAGAMLLPSNEVEMETAMVRGPITGRVERVLSGQATHRAS